MVRGGRAVALVTLALLNLFTIAAGLAVVQLRKVAQQPHLAAATVSRGGAVLAQPGGTRPQPAALAGRLAPLLTGGAPGHVSGTVLDVATGRVLYSHGAGHAATPASTTKLTTMTAALAVLGPDTRFVTRVATGDNSHTIVLVGGGDPTLSTQHGGTWYPRPASLSALATATAKALHAAGTTRVSLRYDDSLYRGSRLAPGWKSSYVTEGSVAPVSALEVDEGRISPAHDGTDYGARSRHPSALAAHDFAALLAAGGIHVEGTPSRQRAGSAAHTIAKVSSPPLSALVEHALTVSDNDLAEAIARHLAIKMGKPATFAGGAAAVHAELSRLHLASGVKTHDGSGLSRWNKITPAALARILAFDAGGAHPRLRSVLTGLPIAHFSGTLAGRYSRGSAARGAGVVHAKTGTLDGVATLAGLSADASGRELAFAFMANDVPLGGLPAARSRLDKLAAAVTSCGCG